MEDIYWNFEGYVANSTYNEIGGLSTAYWKNAYIDAENQDRIVYNILYSLAYQPEFLEIYSEDNIYSNIYQT